MKSKISTKVYKAGIYLRLSKEDTNTNNSIEAQRDITLNYAKAHDFTVVKEYVDNGWSGVLDSRPALNRMIIDIIKKQINMVIVKDLSRLTRDKNKTGYYTEIFFPDNDVRLISVTEFIDSGERYEIDDTIMLRGIMNQSYVADISKKIKSVKTDMKKQGKYIEKNVPYGYKKDDEDKYKVVIDETVSDNVKLIYEMYLQGCSQGEIAKHLTKLKIDTPKKYKGQNITINEWRNDSISRILKDPFYTGKMIINKLYTDYRTKKKYKTPRKEWIFKENTHEAIISQEQFYQVQKILEEKFNKPKNKYEYLLKGLVYCGHCKSRMQYKYRARTKIRNKILEESQKCWYYKCRMIYKFPDICDKGHTIMENTLNEIVLNTVKQKLDTINISIATNKITDEYKENDSNYKEIKLLQNSKIKMENEMRKLYSKRVDEKISIENFKLQYDELKSKLKENEKVLEELQEKNKTKLSKENLEKIIIDFKQGKEFTNEILRQLINRIEVYEDKKVEIEFDF